MHQRERRAALSAVWCFQCDVSLAFCSFLSSDGLKAHTTDDSQPPDRAFDVEATSLCVLCFRFTPLSLSLSHRPCSLLRCNGTLSAAFCVCVSQLLSHLSCQPFLMAFVYHVVYSPLPIPSSPTREQRKTEWYQCMIGRVLTVEKRLLNYERRERDNQSHKELRFKKGRLQTKSETLSISISLDYATVERFGNKAWCKTKTINND